MVQEQFRDALHEIVSFNGNPLLLHDFISTITLFHDNLKKDSLENCIPKFINILKNQKITRKAATRIRQASCNTFDKIKQTLLDTYTDNPPIENYKITMVESKPFNKTAFEYLEYLEKLTNQALNQVKIIEAEPSPLACGIIKGTAAKCSTHQLL